MAAETGQGTAASNASALSAAELTPFNVYLADVSYFSGKLEAYLRYKEIPYQRTAVNVGVLLNEVYEHTGLMKVPVVRMANGQWLKDTTPMLDWLEARFPGNPIMPPDPATHFLAKLVEDYADEWCWRAALYWRWYFPETRALLGRRIAEEVIPDWPLPTRLAGWYFGHRQIQTYLKGDGCNPDTEPFIRDQYFTLLEGMNGLLADQPFVLGSHPSVADIGLFGPLFRHYALDPAPSRVMRDRYPAVYEWVARLWNARQSALGGDIQWSDFSHPGWQPLLKEIVQVYWPYLLANATAWEAGERRFDFHAPDVTYPNLPVVHYRVYCLEVLQGLWQALPESAQQQVTDHLAPFGALAWKEGLDAGLAAEHVLPLQARRRQVGRLERLKLAATGTPWDMPKPFQWLRG